MLLDVVNLQRQFCAGFAFARHSDVQAIQFGHEDGCFRAETGGHIRDFFIVVGVFLFDDGGGFSAGGVDALAANVIPCVIVES